MSALLEVEGLHVQLPTAAGLVTIVSGVDYAVEPGEVFGVAGESGSGKTISMLALLGLLPAGAVTERQRALRRPGPAAPASRRSCATCAGATSGWSSRIR